MDKEKEERANGVEMTGEAAPGSEALPEETPAPPPAPGEEIPKAGAGAEETPAGPEAGPAVEWEREREELISLLQRKQADLDNFRRISRMREEEIRTYGLFNFLEKLLPVVDNLERALEVARDDENVPESHLKGLQMIHKQLRQLLEQEGVVEIEAVGKQFDPHLHEAVMQTAEGEGEPGSVVEEFQKGYLYKDRVLRHAKVKVLQVEQ
ncbi:MAG TPA: nucleotide exchange factor GrpE [Bacillota bacterium]|nr:nucleotide exchange factor GrpE [Bacillota bacterium]